MDNLNSEKIKDMKSLSITNLIMTFFFALIRFTFFGWIGWLGIILILLKIISFIHWSWWLTALPLEYGAIYCLYMTIDGVRYRLGLKDAGGYARFTSSLSQQESENLQIHIIIKEGPEYIGETIDRLSKKQNRLKFNQALLDTSLEHYFLLQLATLGNKKINAYDTIKKWRESGLILPEEGTPEFYPYDDKTQ
jgi:hypothetical protein